MHALKRVHQLMISCLHKTWYSDTTKDNPVLIFSLPKKQLMFDDRMETPTEKKNYSLLKSPHTPMLK